MSEMSSGSESVNERIARLRKKKEFFQRPEAVDGLGTTWASFISSGTSGTIEIQDSACPDQKVSEGEPI